MRVTRPMMTSPRCALSCNWPTLRPLASTSTLLWLLPPMRAHGARLAALGGMRSASTLPSGRTRRARTMLGTLSKAARISAASRGLSKTTAALAEWATSRARDSSSSANWRFRWM